MLNQLEFILSNLTNTDAIASCEALVAKIKTNKQKVEDGVDLQDVFQEALATYGIGIDCFTKVDMRTDGPNPADKISMIMTALGEVIQDVYQSAPSVPSTRDMEAKHTAVENIVDKMHADYRGLGTLLLAAKLLGSFISTETSVH